MAEELILAWNVGSSSAKFALFSGTETSLRGKLHLDRPTMPGNVHIRWGEDQSRQRNEMVSLPTHAAAMAWLLNHLDEFIPGGHLAAVGHRVVHGGQRFVAPTRVTVETFDEMEQLVPLAPLHQPHNLAPIRYLVEVAPHLPQVACFDTAFHQTQPMVERVLALPREFFDRGIQRYGFHGHSYEWVTRQLTQLDPTRKGGRTVALHLGSGASGCALREGVSVATTMAFTPLDGLVMGTRCGSIDPGVVLHLIEREGMTPADVSHLLHHRSGLLGVSGTSADMRELLSDASEHARLAVDLFCSRTSQAIGSLTATLQGIDTLIFTGGIGEHSSEIRQRITESLAWLGISIDPAKNERHDSSIQDAASRVAVYVIPADEERVIAYQTAELMGLMP